MIWLSASRRVLRCCTSHRLVRRMGKCVSHKNQWKTCSYLRWNESACKIPPNWVYCLKARLYCIQRAKMRIQVLMVLFSVKNSRTHTPNGGKEKKHCALAVRMQKDKQNFVLFWKIKSVTPSNWWERENETKKRAISLRREECVSVNTIECVLNCVQFLNA